MTETTRPAFEEAFEYEFMGADRFCSACEIDISLHFKPGPGKWLKCPPIIVVPPRPARLAYGPDVIQVDFFRRQAVYENDAAVDAKDNRTNWLSVEDRMLMNRERRLNATR